MQAAWMIAASLFFALMSVCIKFASPYFGPMEIVCYRGAIGIVFMSIAGIDWLMGPQQQFVRLPDELKGRMDVMGVACGFGYPVGAGPDGPWSAQFADLSEGGEPVLIRVDVTSADVKTPDGLGVGSLPGQIRAAHPTAGSMQEGEYSGFNLTVPIGGGGYLFTFDEPDGPATAVAAGTAEGLSLVEGCA